jgi:phosphate acyltransferase
VKVALDAMGGDFGPPVTVRGALRSLEELENPPEIVLYGNPGKIREILKEEGKDPGLFQIVETTETIEMCEAPATAVRKKKDSPIVRGMMDLKQGLVQGVVSAGSTGAMVAGALLYAGRLPGVQRPAIATWFPGKAGGCIVLDVGANADNKPEHLLQFGVMGHLFAEAALQRTNPRIALLNIGEESSKGSDLYIRAHKMLAESPLNFIGNVEGRDILSGKTDVVVCDGFTGNVVLKLTESIIGFTIERLKNRFKESILKFTRGKLAIWLIRNELRVGQKLVGSDFDYAEHGGAPLLGIKGSVIISHGKSNETAIMNAIRTAVRFNELHTNEKMEQMIGNLQGA